MTIYVDADACPVIRVIEEVSAKMHVPVVFLCDEHHVLTPGTGRVQVVASGPDAVDLALINQCRGGDLVITQDYGVAALALGKGAYGLHPGGKQYTDENISGLLMDRHLAGRARRSGKRHLRGPAKRTPEDDRRFRESLERIILAQAERPGDREEGTRE
ncbi:MAG: YaiI/YqxD family protein [Clostridia bacterium]|nr:YaiI/YqxD family protein [Clostridia bacterium]